MEAKKQLRKYNNALQNYFAGFPLRQVNLKDYIQWIETSYKGKEFNDASTYDSFVRKFLLYGDENLRNVIYKNFTDIAKDQGNHKVLFMLAWLTSFVNISENRDLFVRLDKLLNTCVLTNGTINTGNFKIFYYNYIIMITVHCVNPVYTMLGQEHYRQFYTWCYSDRIINPFINERIDSHIKEFNSDGRLNMESFFNGEYSYLNDENRIRDRLYEIYRYGLGVAKPVVIEKVPEKKVTPPPQIEDFEDETTADKEQFANII